jgi:hypothetical protein
VERRESRNIGDKEWKFFSNIRKEELGILELQEIKRG